MPVGARSIALFLTPIRGFGAVRRVRPHGRSVPAITTGRSPAVFGIVGLPLLAFPGDVAPVAGLLAQGSVILGFGDDRRHSISAGTGPAAAFVLGCESRLLRRKSFANGLGCTLAQRRPSCVDLILRYGCWRGLKSGWGALTREPRVGRCIVDDIQATARLTFSVVTVRLVVTSPVRRRYFDLVCTFLFEAMLRTLRNFLVVLTVAPLVAWPSRPMVCLWRMRWLLRGKGGRRRARRARTASQRGWWTHSRGTVPPFAPVEGFGYVTTE